MRLTAVAVGLLLTACVPRDDEPEAAAPRAQAQSQAGNWQSAQNAQPQQPPAYGQPAYPQGYAQPTPGYAPPPAQAQAPQPFVFPFPIPWAAPAPMPAPAPSPAPAPPAQGQPAPWPGFTLPTITPPAGVQWPKQWPMPTAPGAAPGVPAIPSAGSSDAAQRCVDTINRYRATKALPALARWTETEPCATTQSADDSRTGQPHGTFGRCKEHAQNACPGWPSPAASSIDGCLAQMWAEGPGSFPEHGHYENMVDRRSTKVACGFFTMPNGKVWSVQDFQ